MTRKGFFHLYSTSSLGSVETKKAPRAVVIETPSATYHPHTLASSTTWAGLVSSTANAAMTSSTPPSLLSGAGLLPMDLITGNSRPELIPGPPPVAFWTGTVAGGFGVDAPAVPPLEANKGESPCRTASAALKDPVARMRVRLEPGTGKPVVATGGDGNDLSLYDLGPILDGSAPGGTGGKVVPLWKAKNVKHDMLNLAHPIDVRDFSWVPHNNHGALLVAGGITHTVRMYDPTQQRRPVVSCEMGPKDSVWTRLSMCSDGNTFAMGDTRGNAVHCDLRKLGQGFTQPLGAFKGATGSIRAVEFHPTLPYIAVAGLDRFVRVYNTNDREEVLSMYLKQKLTCLLWSNQGEEAVGAAAKDDQSASSSSRAKKSADAGDTPAAPMAEDELVWGKMTVIADETGEEQLEAGDDEGDDEEGHFDESTGGKKKRGKARLQSDLDVDRQIGTNPANRRAELAAAAAASLPPAALAQVTASPSTTGAEAEEEAPRAKKRRKSRK